MLIEIAPFVVGTSAGKVCSVCGEWKPREMFNKAATHTDGLHTYCKSCSSERWKAWHSEHKEQRAEYQKEYRAENSDAIKANRRAWYEANIDYVRAYTASNKDRRRALYLQNRDAILARQRDYWRNRPDYLKERSNEGSRKYRLTHPEAVRAAAERYRARKRNAPGDFTPNDIEAIRVAQGNRCYICHKKLKKYHVDHFIPLSKGGTNDPGNLRLACPKCNVTKSAKHPHDMGILI